MTGAKKWNKRELRAKEMAETGAIRAREAEGILIRARAAEIRIQDRVEEETVAAGVAGAEARTSRAIWTPEPCGI
jgi:hypothetical protein